MRIKLTILVALGVMILVYLLFVRVTSNYSGIGITSIPSFVIFSQEANEIFVSTIGNNVDLNSGITVERATPLYSDQINNITFAVF